MAGNAATGCGRHQRPRSAELARPQPWKTVALGTLTFLLDANILSELTRSRADPGVLARFKRHRNRVCTAAPVFHELRFGVVAMADSARKTSLMAFLEGLVSSGHEVLAYDMPLRSGMRMSVCACRSLASHDLS